MSTGGGYGIPAGNGQAYRCDQRWGSHDRYGLTANGPDDPEGSRGEIIGEIFVAEESVMSC